MVAESVDACRLGMEKVQLEIEERQPILTIRDAIEKFIQGDVARIGHGDVDLALETRLGHSG